MYTNRPFFGKKFFFEKKIFNQKIQKKAFFSQVDFYTKICRIELNKIFRMNIGLPEFSLKKLEFFFLNYVFSQKKFLRKVREINIHSKSFFKFDSTHFVI